MSPNATRGNRALMRAMNMKIVLDAIRAADNLSQAQLVRQTRLSVGTIVRIVAVLKRRKLVREVGPGAAHIGRKPTQLSFHAQARCVVGLALEADEATVALLDLAAHILHRHTFAFEPGRGPEALVGQVEKTVGRLLRQGGISGARLVGLGASVQGLVDRHAGVIRYSRHLNWTDAPLGPLLEQRLGVPVSIDSEARTKALAEHRWGAATGVGDVLLVEVSTGLGVAVLTEGRPCRGHHGMAGELGQSAVPGQDRCLEDLASGLAMVGAYAPEAGPIIDGSTLRRSLRDLFEQARAGDEKALRIIGVAADHLGLALSAQINVLDPARVILTGIVIDEGDDLFVAPVRAAIRRHVWRPELRRLDIVASPLGTSAALLGAAALVYDWVFDVTGPLLAWKS